MNERDLKSILERLDKLEKAVFPKGKKATPTPIDTKESFVGVVGGIRFLLKEGFFGKRKTLSEVRSELLANDYNYSLQAVQTAVSRLSKTAGPLVTFKENGKKVYAKRK